VEVIYQGRQLCVRVIDWFVNEQGDEVHFIYRVFDVAEEAEIVNAKPEIREAIYQALLKDMEDICAGVQQR